MQEHKELPQKGRSLGFSEIFYASISAIFKLHELSYFVYVLSKSIKSNGRHLVFVLSMFHFRTEEGPKLIELLCLFQIHY